MSLREKIGQLISIGVNGRFLPRDSAAYNELICQVTENHIGGLILFQGDVYESVHLVNRLQRLARYPLLISADMESGAGMRFDNTVHIPWNMAIGATGNPDYARRQGAMIAREARALGIRQIFAPVVDVNNNAANPIINVRSYGGDANDVARFGRAFVEGAQRNGVIATAKHFPGHGDTGVDSHRALPIIDVSLNTLSDRELVPFRAAISAGVGSVMVAYIALPRIDPSPAAVGELANAANSDTTVPSALSARVVTELLRGSLKFDGLVVTDALDMKGLTLYADQKDAAVRAVKAGQDMLIKPSSADLAIQGLVQAVGREIPEKRIEESVIRILAAKYDLGLLKQRTTSFEQVDARLSDREVSDFAKEVSQRAITLVRDDDKLLPIADLEPNARILILAITNGDDRLTIAEPFMSVMSEKDRSVDLRVLDARSSESELQEALELATRAPITIAPLFIRFLSGDPRSISLPEAGVCALKTLISRKKPLVAISFGNPYLLLNSSECKSDSKSDMKLDFKTYLLAYGDMRSLQTAAARAILGEADITGRLPIAIPLPNPIPSEIPRGSGIDLRKLK